MNNPEQLKAERRHRALVAWIKASGETNLELLDRTNPIIANSTLGELDRAITEINQENECGLSSTVKKWMKDASTLSVACEEEVWIPLSEAKWKNLARMNYLNNRTCFLYNEVVIYQVCFLARIHNRKVVICYHVQPLAGSDKPKYYRLTKVGNEIEECVELINLDKGRFSTRRDPHSSFSTDSHVTMCIHTETKPINPVTQPLHNLIKEFNSENY